MGLRLREHVKRRSRRVDFYHSFGQRRIRRAGLRQSSFLAIYAALVRRRGVLVLRRLGD